MRTDLVYPAANFLMFCRSDCKSVFKVLSLSTEMQFSTDLALMNTQPQRIKVDDATRTNDNRGISRYPDSFKEKLLNLVSLTNLLEMLYPRLSSMSLLFFSMDKKNVSLEGSEKFLIHEERSE